MSNRPEFSFSNINYAAIFKRWVLIALGIGVAAHIVDGISYSSGEALVFAVLLLSLFNVVLKPLLILFTLPFIVLTLGIGIIIINAFLFILVGKLVAGFEVASFRAAFFGALIVSIISLIVNAALKSGKRRKQRNQDREKIDQDDDIIDL